ncbi:hypothetical protein [Paenarthrobacter nicotinovorans]|uniref:hypothetical protein n=1 Tax=Paenarthrobacter nicotinovorans TaxID=29320 RepID=UPI003A8025FA
MTTEEAPAKKSAFVVSPIGQPGSESERNANLALRYIFKKALDPAEWVVHRADDGEKPDSIGHHVIRSIVEADLVIADLTDHNPNVFYELAVAHGYRKPVVHLITEGQKIPFDITDQRTISYDLKDPASVDSAITRLGRAAAAALESPDELITPLSSFDSFDTLRQSLRDNPSTGDAIANVLEQITDRMTALEARIISGSRPPQRFKDPAPHFMAGGRIKANPQYRFEAAEILRDVNRLELFLSGDLLEEIPLGVALAAADMARDLNLIDFDPNPDMSRAELRHHLIQSRNHLSNKSKEQAG